MGTTVDKVKSLLTIEDFYTGDNIEKDGKIYKVVDYKKAVDLFDGNYLYGKKVEPTNIRKAIAGEEITTYTEDGNVEGTAIAKEGDIILQNQNNEKDTYIQSEKVLDDYGISNTDISEEFKPFIRKSSPSKILVGIVEEPIVLIIEEWGDDNGPYKQFLDKGATLKLESNKVTGINKGGFEAWKIVDSPVDENNNQIRIKMSKILKCLNGHKFYYDTGPKRRICQRCGYTEVGTYDFLAPEWNKE